MKYCTHCGNKLKDYDNFCSNCGHRQDATIEEPSVVLNLFKKIDTIYLGISNLTSETRSVQGMERVLMLKKAIIL